MKILSKMLSKKVEPAQGMDAVEPSEDKDALMPQADDTGRINSSQLADSDPVFADPSHPVQQKAEEPEVAGSGWEESDWDDDDWDDDGEWGDEDDPDFDIEAHRKTSDKQHLVSEIRDAMVSAKRIRSQQPATQDVPGHEEGDWSKDDEFGRKALARDQLSKFGGAAEERILEKTETVMTDRETSRRRSAMAHLKAAAAATKADRVLSHVVGQDPSADPEEQSPYRDDLAQVVRPHSTSRPISRVVSRPNTRSPIWDQGAGDDDAAMFAAAEDGAEDLDAEAVKEELAAAENERLARAPVDLSEEDFADDSTFATAPAQDSVFPSSRFGNADEYEQEESKNAFEGFEDDDFEDDDGFGDFESEDDDFDPQPSRVVSEAVAFANAPDEEDDPQPEESEVRKKIWEMADEVASDIERVAAEAPPENFVQVAPVVSGRAGRSAGRVKTRLLGFQADEQGPNDVFQSESAQPAETVAPGQAPTPSQFPAGWIVVVAGPGRGACFTLHSGVSQIGRGEEQAVRLDFGDTSISRNNHAAVAYDDEQGKFFLGHGGKSNLVRLNGMPVLSTEEMSNGDEIRIGETTLKFVALCGDAFTWAGQGEDTANA